MTPKAIERASAALQREVRFARQIVEVRGMDSFQEGEDMSMTVLQQLQAFDSNRADVHEMVDMLARASQVKQTYEDAQLPVPEALADGIAALRAEIDTHKKDAIQKRLKDIAAQRTTLLSAQEKRAALDAEEAALKASLAPKEPVTS